MWVVGVGKKSQLGFISCAELVARIGVGLAGSGLVCAYPVFGGAAGYGVHEQLERNGIWGRPLWLRWAD